MMITWTGDVQKTLLLEIAIRYFESLEQNKTEADNVALKIMKEAIM